MAGRRDARRGRAGCPQRLTEIGARADRGVRARGAAPRRSTASARCRAATVAGRKLLGSSEGDVDRAIHELIENHVRYAGAQGFVTNLGGLATMAFTVPDQHLRARAGRVPDDRRHRAPARLRPRRPARAQRRPRLPARRGVGAATWSAPRSCRRRRWRWPPRLAHDPSLDRVISAEVASDLVQKVAGKKLAGTAGPTDPARRRTGRHGRRRLRDLEDRPLRRPRAPAPRAAVGLHRQLTGAAALEATHELLAPAVRRPQVGLLQRTAGCRAARRRAGRARAGAGRGRAARP